MPLKDGTRVLISDGEFKGSLAAVVGYHNHEPITYAVVLDKPVTRTVENSTDLGGGKKNVTTEDVTFTRIEVAEASVTEEK